MSSDYQENNVFGQIAESLISQGTEGITHILENLFNGIMKIERERALGANAYERSDSRIGYANGYKERSLNTRMGQLDLSSASS